MTDQRVSIDPATLFDNIEDRQVEFAGEASGELYRFALRYDVVEAMIGARPDGDAVQQVQRHLPRVEQLAARALGRDYDRELVLISEDDLD